MSALTCPDNAAFLTEAPSALSTRTAVRLVLAAAAVGAGMIHVAFAPEHLREYLPLGVGFVVAGLLQIGWGAYLCARESRRALLLVAGFSLLFLLVYLMSRTVGLPLGPEAFEPEPLGRADLLCCALEVPVALGALLLARRPRALRGCVNRRWAVGTSGALLLVLAATSFSLAAPAHQHACPASPQRTGVLDARGVDTGVTAYFACLLAHEHDGHTGHE